MANPTAGDAPPITRPELEQDSLEPDNIVYIEKVRLATRALSSWKTDPEDVRQALQDVRGVSSFDVEVPTEHARREVQYLKTGVKRLLSWYLRYLSGQLNTFGTSVVRLGETLAARTERLESGAEELAARLGIVEERLRRLESRTGGAQAKRTTPRGHQETVPQGRHED